MIWLDLNTRHLEIEIITSLPAVKHENAATEMSINDTTLLIDNQLIDLPSEWFVSKYTIRKSLSCRPLSLQGFS